MFYLLLLWIWQSRIRPTGNGRHFETPSPAAAAAPCGGGGDPLPAGASPPRAPRPPAPPAPAPRDMAGVAGGGGGNDFQWCFSQVKGAIDEDVAEADIISTVEFNYSGDLLATGDKGGRVVIFQREQEVSAMKNNSAITLLLCCTVSLHLFMLQLLNGLIVFSENPKLSKSLNICLLLNSVGWFGGNPPKRKR